MRELREARQRYFERGLVLWSIGHTTISFFWVLNALLESSARDSRFQMHVWETTESRFQMYAWAALGMVLWLFNINPFPTKEWVAQLACIINSGFLLLLVLPVDNLHKEDIIVAETMTILGLVLVTPACGVRVSISSAFAYSVGMVLSYSQADGVMIRDSFSFGAWHFLLRFPMMMICCVILNAFMETSIRTATQAKVCLAESQAVHSLLTLTCDAVVELDESGEVLTDARGSLQSLLLRGGSLRGLKLQNCLCSEQDRQKLVSTLHDDAATVQHVDMLDGTGSQIKVELFGVRFAAASSEPKYLIGVKEYSDFERRGDMGASHAPAELPSFVEPPFERAVSGQSADSGDDSSERREVKWTTSRAVDVSAISVMSTWKCRPTGRQCCGLHSAVAEMRRATKRISKLRCASTLQDAPDAWQCPSCGAMLDADHGEGECLLCTQIRVLHPPLVELEIAPPAGLRLPGRWSRRAWAPVELGQASTSQETSKPLRLGAQERAPEAESDEGDTTTASLHGEAGKATESTCRLSI